MNSLYHYGSVQANPLYNCSAMSPEEWTETLGVKRVFLGTIVLVFGIFVEIIYVPCLIAIIKRGLLKYSCYKIMFLLGICDMIATSLCTCLAGYLFIKGAVFCSYPELIYICGSIALGGWILSCGLTLMLVINRITDMMIPSISDSIFWKNRTWIVSLIPISYAAYAVIFTQPISFSSKHMAWIGDPLIHPNRSAEYYNGLQNINNIVFITSTILFYSAYSFYVWKMSMTYKMTSGKNVFIQSTLICSINCSSALIYSTMMFVQPHEYVVLFGELTWSLVHGCPAIIYLTMNKTIRQEVISWFKKPNSISTMSQINLSANTSDK